MPRALSLDLRERVIAAIGAGASCRQAAERFGVGPATAIRWQALLRTAAARTVPDLHAAIRHAFTRFTSDECRNCLTAAGYDAYDPT